MTSNKPEASTVQQLMNMGFGANRASRAVHFTQNSGIEPAVQWLTEHGADADIDEPLDLSNQRIRLAASDPVVGVPADVTTVINPGGDRSFAEPIGIGLDCKAVLVVAGNAMMTTGKVASQCALAAVGLYKAMMANSVPWYPAFEAQGEKTIIVHAKDNQEIEKLADMASQLLLPTFLIGDGGRAALLPGSVTVLGLAGPSESVDRITGSLEKLR